jgi:rhamnosyltransferase subunit B
VHQGGIGTIAQALRAGKPMMVVPYSHDQPDNAARVQRIGVARVLKRSNYRKDAIVRTLRELIEDQNIVHRAQAAGEAIQKEDAVASSCQFIEAALK